jgi:hypothetical protein
MSTSVVEEQLRPQLLSGLAYERLLEGVVSGRLAPEQRLRLDLLAHTWAESRTPVREALQRLADMRLVDVSPNAGTRVAAWSSADMVERARIIGALLAREPLVPVARDEAAGSSADASCELIEYLDLADRLIRRGFARLGERLVRDHVDPLRLFVDRATARSHGIDLDAGRERRRELLDAAIAASRRHDPVGAREALATFSGLFVAALSSASPAALTTRSHHSSPQEEHCSVHTSARSADHGEHSRKETP